MDGQTDDRDKPELVIEVLIINNLQKIIIIFTAVIFLKSENRHNFKTVKWLVKNYEKICILVLLDSDRQWSIIILGC